MLDLPIKVYMKSKTKGYDAQGVFDGSGITVLAGSRADLTTRDSIRGSGEDRLRRQYLNSEGVLTQDLYVRSVSTASSFILGRSSNGWVTWRLMDGRELTVFREEQQGTQREAAGEASASCPDKECGGELIDVYETPEAAIYRRLTGNARYFIAVSRTDAPELRLSARPECIRTRTFPLTFYAYGEAGTRGSYQAFFLDEAFRSISNAVQLTAAAGEYVQCEFVLSPEAAGAETCCLGIRDARDARDELSRLIPFEIRLEDPQKRTY